MGLWALFDFLFPSQQQRLLRELKYRFETIYSLIPSEGEKSKGHVKQALKTVEKRLSQNRTDEVSSDILKKVDEELKELENMINTYMDLKKMVINELLKIVEESAQDHDQGGSS